MGEKRGGGLIFSAFPNACGVVQKPVAKKGKKRAPSSFPFFPPLRASFANKNKRQKEEGAAEKKENAYKNCFIGVFPFSRGQRRAASL
jgi:hypothetical protein